MGASTSSDVLTYDDAGRMTRLVRGGVTYDFTYGADDELLRVDRDGVLAFEATFDAEERRVTTRNVGLMATTERRFLMAPSMATSFDSPHLVTDELGSVLATYTYAGEHALSRREGGTEVYYLRDAVGSVLVTVDGDENSESMHAHEVPWVTHPFTGWVLLVLRGRPESASIHARKRLESDGVRFERRMGVNAFVACETYGHDTLIFGSRYSFRRLWR